MSESPYTDAILDYLADQEPHTIAEIREGIGASEGAGIPQLMRNLMTTLSLARDPRKLINHHEGRALYYKIVARNPRNPLPEPEKRETLKMREKIYSVRDWDEHYENSRSRRVDSLRWVPVPNKHDGEGYGLVMEQDDAAELFAAWVLILQVASKCHVRGVLAREDGTAMSARTLAAKTRAPEAWFSRALEFFSANVLWLECHQGDTKVSPEYHPSDTQVTPICPSSADRREGKGIEGKGMEGKERIEDKGREVGMIDLEALSLRISSLVPKWSSYLNGGEQAALFENQRKWAELTEDDWELLGRWYADESPRSEYRIKIKSRLIAEVDAELAKAAKAINARSTAKREF